MCGISGIISIAYGIDTSILSDVTAMGAVQESRGPDNQGHWADGKRAAFAHNRLAIIDLSPAGNQPMESANWVLTYNGEIYNFREIREKLRRQFDLHFKSDSDTETLLFSIEHIGLEETLESINGIYAFSAFHKPSGKLHLVRDRLGVKPLFYYQDEGRFYFASTPAAIARVAATQWKLDRDALYDYFLLGGICSVRTLFQGIRRLDAASHAVLETDGTLTVSKYWQPRPRSANIAELIADAASIQLVSDVPMAILLSGGVDSSVLSATMRDLDAFHLQSDEEKYARMVAERFGMPFRSVALEAFDKDEVMRDYVTKSGEPAMSAIMPYATCAQMRKEGYTVGISANGADELFFGYSRTPTPGLSPHFFDRWSHEVSSFPGLPEQVRDIYRHPENFSVPGRSGALTLPELTDRVAAETELNGFPECARYRWFELQSYVKYDLNPTLDFASMANSIEMRVPFLDHRLVEAALSMSDAELIDSEFSRKAPLKKILSGEGLHPSLWNRPKQGFSLNSKARAAIHNDQVDALRDLVIAGYLRLECRHGSVLRDWNHLIASAWSFLAWKKVWIDGGIVNGGAE